MSAEPRTAVVTGVSTGIGWGIAKVLMENGFTVFGSVRKEADAARLREEFGAAFKPLIFDVTDERAVHAAAAEVREALGGKTLGGLVNNAGIGVGGPLLYLPVDQFRLQLEVNLTGVLIVTQAFAPLLGADREMQGTPGRIVNIGSVGGRHAFPFMGPYHASKYGLEGFSESLRRELMLFGIEVIVIAPGSVATPIWDKAEHGDLKTYDNTVYKSALAKFLKVMLDGGRRGMPPEKIGEAAHRALTAARPKVYYRVTNDRIGFHVLAKLPKRWVDRMVGGRLGLSPPER